MLMLVILCTCSETAGQLSVLVTVLSDEGVGSDVVVQEVGQTLTSVAEELGVNITVISVQRLGKYSLYRCDLLSECCDEFHWRSNCKSQVNKYRISAYYIP